MLEPGLGAEAGPGGGQAVGPVEGELVRAVVGQAGHARPALLGRGPHHPEYLTANNQYRCSYKGKNETSMDSW